MDLFYTDQFEPGMAGLTLSPDESHHAVKVLRKKAGDQIEITNGHGYYISGRIRELKKNALIIDVETYQKMPFPEENHIEVGIGVIRPNRMDWAVEKCTELGVERIVPLICRYSSTRQGKMKHLQKIMVSAIKQSSQYYLPKISAVITLQNWLTGIPEKRGRRFIAHPEGSSDIFDSLELGKTRFIYLAVGPEGGFSKEEILMAHEKHFNTLLLGNSILRTETAAVAGVCRVKLLLAKNPGQ